MRSAEYWAERFMQLEKSQHKTGQECYQTIIDNYRRCEKELNNKLNVWYQRFAENNNISFTEAKKLLTSKELDELKWDINDYIKYGRENSVSGEWMTELENASSKFHISRLEALKLQLQQEIEALHGNNLDQLDSAMRQIYTDGYLHTAFEIQRGTGVGFNFSTLDTRKIDKVIRNPWATDRYNFSQRIWKSKDKLVDEMNKSITRNIALGEDPGKAINEIARNMNVSKSSAGRLVMTEEAYFSSISQHDAFNDLGVEQYEIVATLDNRTSKMCRELDGKHFDMGDYWVGVTAPPFHCYCRTTICPYFDDEFTFGEQRAARGENGKTYYVPSNTKYNEWNKSFGSKDSTVDLQFFAERNSSEKILNKLRGIKDVGDAINKARKESKTWISKLTNDEKNAITKYSYNFDYEKPRFYEKLNEYVRSGRSDNRKYNKHVNNISNGLKKSELSNSYISYRGSGYNPFKNINVGDKTKVNQFLSCSLDPEKAFKNNYSFIIVNDIGVNGSYIEYISYYPEQKEMLFDKDVTYEVLYKKENMTIVRAIKDDIR